MAEAPVNLPRQLKTPRAAAIAGILFAVLAGTTQVLVRLSIPSDAKDSGAWLAGQGGTISLALNLVPFAGIAFLWFMGVVRDHLGRLEDQFFSTVFVGSGLLYLGLTFVSAAVAGAFLPATPRVRADWWKTACTRSVVWWCSKPATSMPCACRASL